MFKVEIATDNAAFTDGNLEGEVARIMRDLADRIERGDLQSEKWCNIARDINGNVVGKAKLTRGAT